MEEEKTKLAEFIELYKSLPSLWKIKSKEYSNRNIKNAEYKVLVMKLKEINPEATKEMVIKKINNLRSAYRRELRKKKDSLKSGVGAEDEYVPTLWYYDMLSFLNDQEESSEGLNKIKNNTSSFEEFTYRPTKKRKIKEVSVEDKLIQMACEKLQRNSETTEGDFMVQSWATQYNELDASQLLRAKLSLIFSSKVPWGTYNLGMLCKYKTFLMPQVKYQRHNRKLRTIFSLRKL